MPSFTHTLNNPVEAQKLVLIETPESSVYLSLTQTEAQELLNRVLNANEEDSEPMTRAILKLADAMRSSARQSAPSETYPAARVA